MIKHLFLILSAAFLFSVSTSAATQDISGQITGIDIRNVHFSSPSAFQDTVIVTLSGSSITLEGCNKNEVFFDAFDSMLPFYFSLILSAKENKKEVHFRIDNTIKAESICGVQIVKLL